MTLDEAKIVFADIWPPRPTCRRTCAEIDEAYTVLAAQRTLSVTSVIDGTFS